VVFAAILVLIEILLIWFPGRPSSVPFSESFVKKEAAKTDSVTFLAFGDINLGRWVGRKILSGEINYPFERLDIKKYRADIVFANLESPISDQKGETGDPKNNLVFTGPPHGTKTLQNAGITLVSTANNHAMDYHKKALFETIDRLTNDSIMFVGTGKGKENIYEPLIIEKKNIKFAIFAVTSFMNFTPKGWKEVVAYADTAQMLSKIDEVRKLVDVVIVSYHGGVEYTDHPIKKVKTFAQWCIQHGVDVFIGHHPHVTFGIESIGNKFIVHSLGNFVFYQPQKYWTQRSYGILFSFKKRNTVISIAIKKILPLNVNFQTSILKDSAESQKLYTRTQKLSNFDLSPVWE